MKNKKMKRKKIGTKIKSYEPPKIMKTYSEDELAKETKTYAQDVASDAWSAGAEGQY